MISTKRATALSRSVTCLMLASVAVAVGARPVVSSAGSSIAPSFSIQHEMLAPTQAVSLLLCVTNENPNSTRSMAAGDAFRFEFGDGLVADCGDVATFSPSGAFEPGDFVCTAEPDSVTFTHVGDPIPWPVGEAVCAPVGYVTGTGPSTVGTSLRLSNRGAWSPARPAAILLAVSSEFAIVPPRMFGAAVMAVSTAGIVARGGQPPRPLPGLDVMIPVQGASRILVTLDAPVSLRVECPPFGGGPGRISVEVDGAIQATQTYSDNAYGTSEVDISWLSDELTGGNHDIRVLVESLSNNPSHSTPCFGSPDNDEYQARLVVIEMPR